MNPIKRVKSEGVSLKKAHLVMILITIVIMCILLFFTFQSASLYSEITVSTDSYIELQECAESLMDASDLLTDRVQRFTVTQEQSDMAAYFDEAYNARRRETAVEKMSVSASDRAAYEQLSSALDSSVKLMETEMRAMKLICDACGYVTDYAEVNNAVLPAECDAMTKEEKIHYAQKMVHDSAYYEQKMAIRSGMDNCIKTLTDDTRNAQLRIKEEQHFNLFVTQVLLTVQSVVMIIMLWLTSYLGINPILKGVQRIRENRKIPVIGSYEFRYLAKTYNKMYEAFQQSIEHLNYDASHDKLTDLYNRAGFDLLCESIDLHSTAVLMIDADKFKEINDSFGHAVGDDVLKKIADALRFTFRREDYICRLGGDEFVVFMLHMDEKRRQLIDIKIDHINRVLADTDDGLPETSISVGVAFGGSEADLETAIKHADEALYEMKSAGRHGCSFYEPDSIQTVSET